MVNNQTVNKENDNDTRKIFTMLVMVFTLMICTTSATYAYFALNATNASMTGTAATASLTLDVQQATLGGTSSGTTQTGVMVPQLQSALGTAMGTNYACVDGNGNTVCKVYTITVTNTSTSAVRVNGTIQFSLAGTDATMPNLKWIRAENVTSLGTNTTGSYNGIEVGNIDTVSTTADITNTSAIFDLTSGGVCDITGGTTTGCTGVSLTKGDDTVTTDSATYYIVVWINEIDTAQYDSGTWTGTITFTGENGKGVTSTITA